MIFNKNEIVLQAFFMHKLKEKADKLYHYLSQKEQERASQYSTSEKRDRFILSRGTLKKVLSKYLEDGKRSNNPILGKGKRSLNQAVVCSQFQGSKLS